MQGTLTIRLDDSSARALRERARAENRSASDLVRSLIEREVGTAATQEPTAMEKSRRFVGSVKSGPVVGGRRSRELLENWNPDRRG